MKQFFKIITTLILLLIVGAKEINAQTPKPHFSYKIERKVDGYYYASMKSDLALNNSNNATTISTNQFTLVSPLGTFAPASQVGPTPINMLNFTDMLPVNGSPGGGTTSWTQQRTNLNTTTEYTFFTLATSATLTDIQANVDIPLFKFQTNNCSGTIRMYRNVTDSDGSDTPKNNSGNSLYISSGGSGGLDDTYTGNYGVPAYFIPAIMINVAPTDPTVCSGNNGAFTLSGLVDTYVYTLSYIKDGIPQTPIVFTASGTTYIVNGLIKGSYANISVSNGGCTSNIASTTLKDPSAATITLGTPTNPSSCGTSTGSFMVSGLVSGTTYTLKFKKNGTAQPSINVVASSTSYTISSLGAGSYTDIFVSNAGCNSNSLSQVLNDLSAPVITLGTITQPSACDATDGSVIINGLVAGSSYTLNYVIDGIAQPSQIIVPTDTTYMLSSSLGVGNYTGITVTNGACISNSLAATLSTTSAPVIGVLALDAKTCTPGKDGGFIVTGLLPNVAYTLNYKFGTTSKPGTTFTNAPNFTSYMVTGLAAGTYTSISITQGTCISNKVQTVVLAPSPATISVVSPTNPTSCSGNDGAFTVSGLVNGTAYTLSYTKDGMVQSPVPFTASGTIYTVTGLIKGSYTNISVSNAGCISNIPSTPLTLSDPTAASITLGSSTNPTSCGTSTGTLIVSGLMSGTTYTLKFKKNGIVQPSINVVASSSSYTISSLGAGSYTDIFVSNAGCNSNSLSQVLNDLAAPVIVLGTITQPTGCGTTDGSVRITGLVSGSSYTLNYVKDGIAQASQSISGVTTYTIPNLGVGNYTGINVTGGACISNSLVATLSTTNAPIIDVLAFDTKTCTPGKDGGFIVTGLLPNVAYTLNYMIGTAPQPAVTIPATNALTTFKVSGLAAGTYSNISISQAGCISNKVQTVVLAPSSAATITIVSPTNPTSCSGNDGSFTLSGLVNGTAYTLSYTKDGMVQSPAPITSTTGTYTVTGLIKGSYTNISVSSVGCISNTPSGALTLSDPTAASITLGTPTNPTSCGTSTGSLIVSGLASGTTYTLKFKKNGIVQPSVNVVASSSSYTISSLGAGSYTDIFVSNAGCNSNSLSQVLNDLAAPVIAFGTVTQPTACGTTDGSVIITGLVSGSSYTLNYVRDGIAQASQPISGVTTYTIPNLGVGNYTGITVTTQGACISNSLAATLSTTNAPIIDVLALDTKTCSGTDGGFIVTGLLPNVAYTLNYMIGSVAQQPTTFNTNASTTFKVPSLAAGAYSNISITQGGCISNKVQTVVLAPSPAVAPVLSKASISNACPKTTVDLTSITANTPPAGYTLEWHNATPLNASNKVADATSVGTNVPTYYATFYNATTMCYGATSPVSVTVTVCSPSLTMVKSVQSGSIPANTNFNYTLTVGNKGTGPTVGQITVKDILQTNLAFVSGSGTGWSCNGVGQTVTCTSSTAIAAGTTSIITLIVNATQTGPYRNIATTYGGGDPVHLDATTATKSDTIKVTVGNSVKVTIKAFLNGAYVKGIGTNAGMMQDSLRKQGIIPLTQPYGKAPYTDIPDSSKVIITTTSNVLSVTGHDAIVDWVMVELRAKANPSKILYGRAGLIQRDGDIVDIDGVSCLSFSGVSADTFYIAVRHRNHLGVMTAKPIALTNTCSALIDFTSRTTAVYTRAVGAIDYSAYPQALSPDSVMTMWAGNTRADNYVIFQGTNNDKSPVFSLVSKDPGNTGYINNYIVRGYLRQDINVNGTVIFQGPNNDINLLFSQVFNHPKNTTRLSNFIIKQQLP